MDPIVTSGIIQGGASLLGMGIGGMQQAGQNRRQRDLMNLQLKNQMKLNQQGADLSYENWLRTNYSAQRAEMEKAGLNVGMMYGGSGQGGTLTGGGGGSAAGGQAAAPNNQMAMLLGDLASNIAVKQAQARNLNVQSDTIEGKNELGGLNISKLKADTGNVQQDTALKAVQQTGLEIQNYINDKTKELTIENAETLSRKLDEELKTLKRENYKGDATLKTDIAQAKANLATTYLQQKAIKAGIELTEEQTRAIGEELAQGWEKLSLTHDSNKIQFNETLLKKYLGEKNLELIYRGQNIELGKAVSNIIFGGPKTSTTSTTKYDKQGNYAGESTTTTTR
jgi:hypothetical protein